MRTIVLVVAVMASTAALAQVTGRSGSADAGQAAAPSPEIQALGQMIDEGKMREARALSQAYTLRGEVTRLQKQVDDLQAENAKLKARPEADGKPAEAH